MKKLLKEAWLVVATAIVMATMMTIGALCTAQLCVMTQGTKAVYLSFVPMFIAGLVAVGGISYLHAGNTCALKAELKSNFKFSVMLVAVTWFLYLRYGELHLTTIPVIANDAAKAAVASTTAYKIFAKVVKTKFAKMLWKGFIHDFKLSMYKFVFGRRTYILTDDNKVIRGILVPGKGTPDAYIGIRKNDGETVYFGEDCMPNVRQTED